MTTRFVKSLTAMIALGMLGGCAATAGDMQGKPILSAEQAQSMIRVEVRTLEPLPVEQALADLH